MVQMGQSIRWLWLVALTACGKPSGFGPIGSPPPTEAVVACHDNDYRNYLETQTPPAHIYDEYVVFSSDPVQTNAVARPCSAPFAPDKSRPFTLDCNEYKYDRPPHERRQQYTNTSTCRNRNACIEIVGIDQYRFTQVAVYHAGLCIGGRAFTAAEILREGEFAPPASFPSTINFERGQVELSDWQHRAFTERGYVLLTLEQAARLRLPSAPSKRFTLSGELSGSSNEHPSRTRRYFLVLSAIVTQPRSGFDKSNGSVSDRIFGTGDAAGCGTRVGRAAVTPMMSTAVADIAVVTDVAMVQLLNRPEDPTSVDIAATALFGPGTEFDAPPNPAQFNPPRLFSLQSCVQGNMCQSNMNEALESIGKFLLYSAVMRTDTLCPALIADSVLNEALQKIGNTYKEIKNRADLIAFVADRVKWKYGERVREDNGSIVHAATKFVKETGLFDITVYPTACDPNPICALDLEAFGRQRFYFIVAHELGHVIDTLADTRGDESLLEMRASYLGSLLAQCHARFVAFELDQRFGKTESTSNTCGGQDRVGIDANLPGEPYEPLALDERYCKIRVELSRKMEADFKCGLLAQSAGSSREEEIHCRGMLKSVN